MDETAAIQALLDGHDRVALEPRLYEITGGGLRLRSGITLDMSGAVLALLPGCALKCKALETEVGAQDVRIIGGTVVGDMSPTPSFRVGLRIDGATDVAVEGTRFIGWRTDGVWIGGNASSAGIRLSGVVVEGFGRNGVSIVNADGVVLERCRFKGAEPGANPGAGVDVEPNLGERVSRLTIIDCDSTGNEIGLYLHPGRGLVGAEYRIIGNTLQDNRKYGLILNSVQTALVYDNLIAGSPKGISVGAATEATRAAGVLIAENFMERCAQGIVLAGVKESDVIGNSAGPIAMPALGISGDMGFKRNV